MVRFPNCKINLGLRVAGKRPDGYHDIETIFYPLPLKDALELIPAPANSQPEFGLTISGLEVPGDAHTNLCYKAWALIKTNFPSIGPAKMHLLKAIPIGAGLGGGSSDGTTALLLLDEEFHLHLSAEQLFSYALRLGSDCPFFLVNKPCLATGRGEQLKEIALTLEKYYLVLVDPNIHISTAWAFDQITAGVSPDDAPLEEIIRLPVAAWKDRLTNVFEAPVMAVYPALQNIRERLYAAGAVYASLTGTGSCVYGVFPENVIARLPEFSGLCQVHSLKQHS